LSLITEITRGLDALSLSLGEAVATAVYVLNRSRTKGLNGVTPYEAWYGKKPSVKHMKIFGCIGHVKKIGPDVHKLSDRSQRMVFIGYEEGTKGYRLLESVSKELHVRRDVIFEEDQAWDWTNLSENNQRDQFAVEFPICYRSDNRSRCNRTSP